MKPNDSAVLNLENSSFIELGTSEQLDTVTAASQLQFQDFPLSPGPQAKLPTQSHFNQSIEESQPDEEDEVLLGKGKQQGASPPFWEMAYFARYFDVTTQDVFSRILWSVIPFQPYSTRPNDKGNYISRHIQFNPDLYGPLWINITLIFAIAICGNIANYLSSNGEIEWHYDFSKIGLAASTVTTYTIGVPTALWFFFWFRGCTSAYTLLETVCAYGYSLSIYIPISVLWMFGIKLIQYVLVIVGALLSGSVLLMSFAPVVKSDPSQTVKLSYMILLVIIAMHALVAFTFLAYFF